MSATSPVEGRIVLPSDNQLAIAQDGIRFSDFNQMADFSVKVLNSGLAPKSFSTPEAIMVAIQTGLEIGLKPMQALQGIAVINGRPTVWGDAALAIVKAHPEFVDMREDFERGKDDENMMAICVVERSAQTPVRRTFSVADAKKAGLWGKTGPWSQYPKRMLAMRARAFALRDSFPDALKGCAIREEVADYTKPAKAREVKSAGNLQLPEPEEPTTKPGDLL